MLLLILSIFDLVAGAALSLCEIFPYVGSGFIGTMAGLMILKGLWSILTAAAAGFFFDLIGILDLVAGILLYLATLGLVAHFFVYIGIALILKGFYSLMVGIIAAGR